MRALLLASLFLISCSSREGGDPHSDQGVPTPQGKDLRIAQVNNPSLPDHAAYLAASAVTISGATVIAVDTFDETNNGKSIGTIYVQDLGSQAPFSGTSLFAPSFVPGNLRVGAGDVLDLHGPFQENTAIGSQSFAPGWVLPQLARPTATFRLELSDEVKPVDIDVEDLTDAERGRQWINMLVRIRNPKLDGDISRAATAGSGRLNVSLVQRQTTEPKCEEAGRKTPSLNNSLADIGSLEIKKGTPIKSITGVVSFFCQYSLSPRSLADIEL